MSELAEAWDAGWDAGEEYAAAADAGRSDASQYAKSTNPYAREPRSGEVFTPRIIGPEEAKRLLVDARGHTVASLAHTAIVRGEQRDAVLAIHWTRGDYCNECGGKAPCLTRRILSDGAA